MGGDGLPYAPIVGAMRDLVTQHGREQILEWAGAGRRALGALVPDLGTAPRENDDTIRLRLYEAVTMLLERASENGPLVVIMEDIHWADESTRHVLRFLVRAVTGASVMIITTYRSAGVGPGSADDRGRAADPLDAQRIHKGQWPVTRLSAPSANN